MPGQTTGRSLASSELEQSALELGVEAYIYGYPLVLMDVTRSVLTNAPKPAELAAPLNQFCHVRTFPDDTMTKIVSPNADTLYSSAWLDLTKEPLVMSVPEIGKRYYLMQLLDAWTNVFASPGTRTTGNGPGDFAIYGPDWAGILPTGVQGIRSPTNTVWIIGRTQTNGKDDYRVVHVIQDQYKLTPLSEFGKAYTTPANVQVRADVDMDKPPVEQVADMSTVMFFSRLNDLMKENPPTLADAEAIRRFAALGIGPSQTFELESLDRHVAKGLEGCVEAARTAINSAAKKPYGKKYNGWEFVLDAGQYGTDYLRRAVVAFVGLGANLAEDAIYPCATNDPDGLPLNGSSSYEITFLKGQLPPVGAFWSITLYNSKHFFVKNSINRYAIGDRDALKFNDDGSLTIYVQNSSPGPPNESNWLPAPRDIFSLLMRLYWPKKQIIEGLWRPPAIERTKRTIRVSGKAA